MLHICIIQFMSMNSMNMVYVAYLYRTIYKYEQYEQ